MPDATVQEQPTRTLRACSEPIERSDRSTLQLLGAENSHAQSIWSPTKYPKSCLADHVPTNSRTDWENLPSGAAVFPLERVSPMPSSTGISFRSRGPSDL